MPAALVPRARTAGRVAGNAACARLRSNFLANHPPSIMKTLVLLICTLMIQVSSEAQTTEKEWQQEAVKQFPELAVKDSAFNKLFLAEFNRLKASSPDFFRNNPKWPLLIASQCSKQLSPPSIIPGLDAIAAPLQKKAPASRTVAAVADSLKNIIFPKIDFRDATLTEIIQHLNIKSKELDPQKTGVPITITPSARQSTANVRITLTLKNVPQVEAIKYITNLANLAYRIEDWGVSVASLDALPMATKVWNDIAPIFLNGIPAKKVFEDNGITFRQGASAGYDARTQQLSVTNTEDQLELVDRIISIVLGKVK